MTISHTPLMNALKSLEEAVAFVNETDDESKKRAFRDAAIQRFEFCIELSWKVSAKVLGSSSTTARPVIREMAQNGLIKNPEVWFDFIEARNKTSHSYDDKIASEVFLSALKFIPEAKLLIQELKKK